MEENKNKTGVWVLNGYGTLVKLKQSLIYPINTNDRICIMSPKYHVICEVKSIAYYSDSTRVSHYYLNPVQSIYGAGLAAISHENTTGRLYIMVHLDDGTLVFDGDLIEEYLKCGYVDSNTSKVIILPKGQETMNENLEIKTCMSPADKIKIDVLTRLLSEPIKNWLGGFSAPGKSRMMHDDCWLSSYAPTHIDWNGEMSATLTFLQEKIDETMNKLAETKKEKEMYTEKLKDKIKKVIYVDKEMTVKEPVLDNNGKQIEKDGEPVFKVKHYHGMVKILWTSGAETVAYVEGNDVYDRENGFKTCVLKYLCGNAGAHDAVDFWTNKYVKYPSSCIEVTENLCKLEKILEKDKYRKDDQKGLPHAKFFMEIRDEMLFDSYDDESLKNINEFKKLAKKYFPELKGKEIYINDNRNDEIFVAIK